MDNMKVCNNRCCITCLNTAKCLNSHASDGSVMEDGSDSSSHAFQVMWIMLNMLKLNSYFP